MTAFGKTLVLLTVALSLVFFGYALVVFAFPIDWGWDAKNAPMEGGQPVKSKFAEAEEKIKQLGQAKERAVADWVAADNRIKSVEGDIAERQYQYSQILTRVQSDPVDFEIKDLQKNAGGEYVPDPDTGLPAYAEKVADKTYAGYVKELRDLLKQIEEVRSGILDWVKQEKQLAEQLNGKTDPQTGQKIGKGLYDLIAHEKDVHRRAEAELEELEPRYYQELVDSQLFLDRQKQLRARIKELENARQTRPEP